MLKFEIKKVFSKRVNQIAMLVLLLMVVIGGFLTINDVKYIEEDGKKITGLSAARRLREDQNEWKG